jgi:hypothetical protein
MAYEKNPDEIGSLWAKQGGKGPYLTGEINGEKVVCFPVKSDNPKAPAWRVMKSRPIEQRDTQPKGRDIGGGFVVEGDDIGF